MVAAAMKAQHTPQCEAKAECVPSSITHLKLTGTSAPRLRTRSRRNRPRLVQIYLLDEQHSLPPARRKVCQDAPNRLGSLKPATGSIVG